jgi:hypothetical protein
MILSLHAFSLFSPLIKIVSDEAWCFGLSFEFTYVYAFQNDVLAEQMQW